ncbi:glycosyltransferase [Coraliomargarita algicola]|uniref:Glycosyltransferase n=1 Tax=Coraliomargarita algicola TaxID=3092156 RepID=A0ABZ0RJP5_9BACT|nr:glycosyltransferase [Coraliomargarita sp. J2-16]WPJ94985.1 glycosyltransferase [Coraliomargarita sp. J2-16]
MLKIDIYWDLRATDPVRHTGVGKHVIEVIKGLVGTGLFDVRMLIAKDQVEMWAQQAVVYDWSRLNVVHLPYTNKGYRFRVGAGLPLFLDHICEERDLVYSPMEIVLSLKHIPFINTIHGIPCFERTIQSDVYNSGLYRKERVKQSWFFARSRRLCRANFVVSDYLKERLRTQFGFNSNCLYSVYNGAEDFYYRGSECGAVIGESSESIRLLQVGGANIFDGAPALLQVARQLEKVYPQARLEIVGDRHEAPWEQLLRAQSNVEWSGFLNGPSLLEAMQRSTALLYLPAVESFGIIGVEAMAAGLPILAMKSTALPEVLGDAALWVNGEDSRSLAAGLKVIVEDDSVRDQLIARGRKRANCYRWSNVVERVVEGFQQVLSN